MKATFIVIASLLVIVEPKDDSTLSNYETIKIVNISGVFEPNFEEKILCGNLNYTFEAQKDGENIVLDSKNLEIMSISFIDRNEEVKYHYENEDENLGIPLNINCLYKASEIISLNIIYCTKPEGEAVQFISKSQTLGKEYDFFFTQSEMILGRQLIPIQDTPAVKFTFYLGIKVDKEIFGMISGLPVRNESNSNETITYYYQQQIPIPNYLIALAAGAIKRKDINNNISIYSEEDILEDAYYELNDDLPRIFDLAVLYMGDYNWGKYNILVMPKSFPYSGMENPCLTFCSPCLINGDKSLIDIIAHELIHSWSGNLVTNENWRDFWLNEGITMFLQRKIVGKWKSPDYAKMDAILGLSYIEESLDYFGENSIYTTLRPDLTGISPDDIYSDIPYEKGFNFMYHVESLIGEDKMQNFFQSYFKDFENKSIDFYQFQKYLNEFCKNKVNDSIINKLEWEKWVFEPGRCPPGNDFTNSYSKVVDEEFEKFINGRIDDNLVEKFNSWIPTAKTVFMTKLEERDELLTDAQHDFLTKKLNLYKGQNFLISTYYFRLILKKTNKFYDLEMEGLLDYLSSYGVVDYMSDIYYYFYLRDKIKAGEAFKNNSEFYNKIMIEMVENEIKEANETFFISALDFESNNQCLLYSDKIKIRSNYNKNDSIEILNGIYLQSNDSRAQLNCYLNSTEQYCLIKNIKKTGEYYLNVPNIIENKSYIVNISQSESRIKIYLKDFQVKNANFSIDYYDKKEKVIEIECSSEPEQISVINTEYNKQINCEIEKLKIKCKINNDILPVAEDNADEFKEYELQVIDYCGNIKSSIYVNVKNTEDTIGTKAILVIIIIGLLVVIIVSFFIYRSVNKKKSNLNVEEVNPNKLINEM